MAVNGRAAADVVQKRGRPKGKRVAGSPGTLPMKNIQAVKALGQRMGAEKVQEPARVLGERHR